MAMQADGVSVFPYINGRIFDIASDSYVEDGGAKFCNRKAAQIFGAANITLYEESYGSDATFNVADPTAPYWQVH